MIQISSTNIPPKCYFLYCQDQREHLVYYLFEYIFTSQWGEIRMLLISFMKNKILVWLWIIIIIITINAMFCETPVHIFYFFCQKASSKSASSKSSEKTNLWQCEQICIVATEKLECSRWRICGALGFAGEERSASWLCAARKEFSTYCCIEQCVWGCLLEQS